MAIENLFRRTFKNKASAIKEIFVNYLVSAGFLMVGLIYLSEYSEKGYAYDDKFGLILEGPTGHSIIKIVIYVALIGLIYSVYVNISYYFYKKNDGFSTNGSPISEYGKCTKCGLVSKWEGFPNKTCPRCGSKADDLNGYFDRHPDAGINRNI